MKKTSLIMTAFLALVLLPGCIIKTGRPLSGDQARTLAPGASTKQELLERFGAPAAILAGGEITVVNSYSVRPGALGSQYTYSFSADTIFELFPPEARPDRYRRIYYYRHVTSTLFVLPLLFWFHETGNTKTDHLWVLVDERTEKVEDYAFRKYGKRVLFGRPRIEDRERTAPP